MRRTVRTTALTSLLALAVLMLGATAAFAQYPPDEEYGVSCTPEEPAPGDDVDCTVVGAQSGETLTVSAADVNGVFYEDTVTADQDGTAAFSFSVPADAEGDITVQVSGEESGETASVLSAAAEGEADEVDPDDVDAAGLPVTGGQLAVLTALGLALMGSGGLALRKRTSSSRA